jgi:hypothetical protein
MASPWFRDPHTVLQRAQMHLVADCPEAIEPRWDHSQAYWVRCAVRILAACADLVDLAKAETISE